MATTTTDPNRPGPDQPAPPPRKRRRWPWILLALLLIVGLLVVLLPTLASTSPVRSIVESQVNQRLNGRVAIGGYSVGWLDGVRARDVKVYDARQALVLEIDEVRTDLSLLDAARGNLDLGDTVVTLNLTRLSIDENGNLSYLDLLPKTSPEAPAPSEPAPSSQEPVTLPDVRGNLTVNLRGGTIEGPQLPRPVHLSPSQVKVSIPDINQPITYDATLGYRLGDDTPATIASSGTVLAVRNNQLDVASLTADVTASLKQVNLAPAGAFVAAGGEHPLAVTGVANGQFKATVNGLSKLSADGAITIEQPSLAGGPLTSDRLATKQIVLTTRVNRDDTAGGAIRIDEVSLVAPEGSLKLTGAVPEAVLNNLAARRAPGGEGQLVLAIDAPDLAPLIAQLPATLKLVEGVAITGARYKHDATITFHADHLASKQSIRAAASGTRDGKPIALSPVSIDSDATVHALGRAIPDLRDLAIKLATESGSLDVAGGGPTLAGLNVDGRFDLDRLSREIGQFVDLGGMTLAGRGQFKVASEGNPTHPGATLGVNASLDLVGVRVAGVGELPPIDQPRTTGTLAAAVTMPAEGQSLPGAVNDVRATLQTFDAAGRPIIDLLATATGIDPSTLDVRAFELVKLDVPDLAAAQAQADPFVPALREMKLAVQGGSLKAGIAGRFDGATRTLVLDKPLDLSASDVTATLDGKPLLTRETIRSAVAATVSLPAEGSPSVRDLRVTFATIPSGQEPLIDAEVLAASIDAGTMSVRGLDVKNLAIRSLPTVQQRVEAIVPAAADSGLRVSDGQFYLSLAGDYDGQTRTLTLTRALEASLPNLTASKLVEGRPQPLLNREKLTARAAGTVQLPEGGLAARFSDLSVTSSSGLVSVQPKDGEPIVVTMDPTAGPGGSGTLLINADLKRLSDLAQAFTGDAGGAGQVQSGTLETTIAFATEPARSVTIDGAIRSLTVTTPSDPIRDQSLAFNLSATADGDPIQQTAFKIAGSIDSPLVAGKLADAYVLLARKQGDELVSVAMWDLVERGSFTLTVPDLAKVQSIVNAFVPPAPATPAAVAPVARPVVYAYQQPGPSDELRRRLDEIDRRREQDFQFDRPARGDQAVGRPAPGAAGASDEPAKPLPPLQVLSGSLALQGSIARDAASKTTRLQLDNLQVSQLDLRRGEQAYRFDDRAPVSLKLIAEVVADAAPGSETPMLQQIQQVRVSELTGDLQVASLSMPKPIVLRDLSAATPTASGTLAATGSIDRLVSLLAVVGGGEPMPYGGTFALQQDLATDGRTISLVGNVDATQVTVHDAADRRTVLHTEPQIAVRNAVALSTGETMSATIRDLSVQLPASNAASLKVVGSVRDLAAARTMDGVAVDLAYDLAKVWPIVRPMLPAAMQKDAEQSAMSGRHQTRIPIGGSFPAVDPRTKQPLAFHESIRSLQASGVLAAPLVDLLGMKVESLEVPFVLTDGQVQLVYAGRTGPDRLPRPAQVNGGTMDLGGIVIDLGQPTPLVSIGRNQPLMRRVRLTPVLADKLGTFAGLLFKDTQRATGLLDVTVQRFDRVPVTELHRTGQDNARVVFSVSDLTLDGGFATMLATAVSSLRAEGGGLGGTIRDAVVELKNGSAVADVTFTIGRNNLPLRYRGGIDMQTFALQDVSINVPSELFGWKDLVKVAPDGIPLKVVGTLSAYRFEADVATIVQQKLLEGGLRNIPGLPGSGGGREGGGREGGGREGGAGGNEGGGGGGNPLEDLLRGLNRDRERDRGR
jgi:hypothetical protein